MIDTIFELITSAGLVLFCLIMFPIGLFVLLGGLNSFCRYWWRENKQHQTLFVIIGLLTVTVAGGFLATASSVLLWQEIIQWLQ